MQLVILIFILLASPLSATYVVTKGTETLTHEQKTQLFDLMLRGEPPRIFYDSVPLDLKSACRKLSPPLCLKWIPPTLWQLSALHAFFNSQDVHHAVLACMGKQWDPLSYDEMLLHKLPSASNLKEITECFDSRSKSLPHLCELFFQVNKAAASLCSRAGDSDLEMMRLAISELPPYDKWPERGFPFWKSPWIHNPNSAQIFYNALQDESLLSQLIKIERIAHRNGEWVLYRGYDSTGFPSTIQKDDVSNHALSFGSTLLGGVFFSLDACALTYAKPDAPTPHSFLALRIKPKDLKELFRVGPLHPLLQMLADGEMFHAHTKIAACQPDEYKNKPLNGYFMKCNKNCIDPLNYILTLKMTPKELEQTFHSLCEKSGHLFFRHDSKNK